MTDALSHRFTNMIPAAASSLRRSPWPVRALSVVALESLERAARSWSDSLDEQVENAKRRTDYHGRLQVESLKGHDPRRTPIGVRGDGSLVYDSARERFDFSHRANATPVPPLSPAPGDLISVLASRFPERPDAPWAEIPIGIGREGPVVWDVDQAPHLLGAGATGSDKTNLQRVIIEHCLSHPDRWAVVAVDLHGMNFASYGELVDAVHSVEEAVHLLRAQRDLMVHRYRQMGAEGVSRFGDLVSDPPAVMIIVDELYGLLTKSWVYDEHTARAGQNKEEIQLLIQEIAAQGRAAGIHLSVTTQRPEPGVLGEELRVNFKALVATSRLDATSSRLVLGNESAAELPADPGRGYFQVDGDGQPFQAYRAQES